jgi:hypothetical protein
LHYFSRYEVHAESQEKENELRDRTEARVTELMDLSITCQTGSAHQPTMPSHPGSTSAKAAGKAPAFKAPAAPSGPKTSSALAPPPKGSLASFTAAAVASPAAQCEPVHALTRIDLQYLIKAAEALIRCRRSLKNTYPLAYYMPDGQAKRLFEHLQADLDETTEKLSGLLEAEHGADRTPLVLCTASALQRLSHFTEWVEQGMASEAARGEQDMRGDGPHAREIPLLGYPRGAHDVIAHASSSG